MSELPVNTKANYQLIGGTGFKPKGGYGSSLNFYKNNNKLYFETYSATTKNRLISKRDQWEKNKWFFVVAVNNMEKGEKYIYINGILDTTAKTFTNSLDWSKTKFTIGKGGFTVDDLSIFNRPLSSNEVLKLYQQTK